MHATTSTNKVFRGKYLFIYFDLDKTYFCPLYVHEPLSLQCTLSGQQFGGFGTKSAGWVSQCKHWGSKTSRPKSVGHSIGAHSTPVLSQMQYASQPSWNSSPFNNGITEKIINNRKTKSTRLRNLKNYSIYFLFKKKKIFIYVYLITWTYIIIFENNNYLITN